MSLANRKTVVVIQSGGSFATGAWLENVPVLLEGWYGGQEIGAALAETLFGDVNPSGHLPFSFERTPTDNPSARNYYADPRTGKVVYREGIFVGYRGFWHSAIEPLFPFGYGLSYTTFKFSNLRVGPAGKAKNEWQASFDVTNTGSRAGMEVAQLYIAEPDAKEPRPPEELKGFKKIKLLPGQTQQVTLRLDARAFAYFDSLAGRWRVGSKRFEVLVGDSSAQIDLRRTIVLRGQ
jgi:beta-glucosidase